MSLRSAISALVLLPMFSPLIGCIGCGDHVSTEEGAIAFIITGRRMAASLGIDQCDGLLDPDEILKSITIHDPEGSEVALVTVRGRDALVYGADRRSCAIRVVRKVEVQEGLDYRITVDSETTTYTNWGRP